MDHYCCCLVSKLYPTLCDSMGCSMPGIPIPHHLQKFAQVHVHWVGDAIQPSHPLLSPSPSAFILASIRVFSGKLAPHIRCPKYWSFSISISPTNEYSGLSSFKIHWFDFAVQGTLKSFLQYHSSKASILWCSASLGLYNGLLYSH